MGKNIVIGTRGSVLALWQANFIKSELERRFGLSSELKIIKTTGDKILDAPLSKIGGKGLFTKEIEDSLLRGEITLAVHSLKDVPVNLPAGLVLAAITRREDRRDCFLSHGFESLESLPKNARIGTTSLRRAMQLKAMRSDFKTISLRGNVQTRLLKLKNGEFDAIILALAALKRLELGKDEVAFISPLETSQMLPAMAQGALGIECREDCAILDSLRLLNCPQTSLECGFERDFIRLLDGGCQVPIGVTAKLEGEGGESCVLEAIIGLPNGAKIVRDSIRGAKTENLALALLKKLESQGAREILSEALRMVEEGFFD